MNLPDRTSVPPWWNDGRLPTNAELAHWLAVTSDANRDWWLDRIAANATDACRCFEMAHESQIEQLRQELGATRERLAWLERHYVARQIVAEYTADDPDLLVDDEP